MSSAASGAAWKLEEAPPTLAVELCGITLASPVVLLSGCVGFGEEYTRVEGFDNRDAGAICLKGTTLEPRLGNPPHRVHETPCGMLNSIGLQNPGSREVIDRILPGLDFGRPGSSPTSPALPLPSTRSLSGASTTPRSMPSRSISPVPTWRREG